MEVPKGLQEEHLLTGPQVCGGELRKPGSLLMPSLADPTFKLPEKIGSLNIKAVTQEKSTASGTLTAMPLPESPEQWNLLRT